MNGAKLPAASGTSPDPADAPMDDGRRYWKAAIAHLAPEKREAAWEFYLDRLESSAAADTLGGVMLLLEAHLAFFDDLPARLGQAAQQIEAAFQAPRLPADGGTMSANRIAALAPTSVPRWRRHRMVLVPAFWATMGGLVVYAVLAFSWHSGSAALAITPARADHLLYPYAGSIRVEPWNDSATRRSRGVIVSFGRVAWTERTLDGGAKVYMPSPIEEVRRDLEVLRGASK